MKKLENVWKFIKSLVDGFLEGVSEEWNDTTIVHRIMMVIGFPPIIWVMITDGGGLLSLLGSIFLFIIIGGIIIGLLSFLVEKWNGKTTNKDIEKFENRRGKKTKP